MAGIGLDVGRYGQSNRHVFLSASLLFHGEYNVFKYFITFVDQTSLSRSLSRVQCYKTGLRVRTAIVFAVYRKALLLSAAERQSKSLGEITNLMSIDAQRLQGMIFVDNEMLPFFLFFNMCYLSFFAL